MSWHDISFSSDYCNTPLNLRKCYLIYNKLLFNFRTGVLSIELPPLSICYWEALFKVFPTAVCIPTQQTMSLFIHLTG